MGAHLSAERPLTMSKESEAIDASSVAPAESATPIDTKDDALDIGAPNAAVAVAEENVEPEKSTKDQDSTPTSASHASIDTEIEGKQASDHNRKCSECDLVESSTKGDRLCVCIGCKMGVHRKCLVEMMPLMEDEALQKDEELKDSEWKCDCCRLGVERRVTKCVYCGKIGGDKALKVVETGEDAEFWRQYTGFGENGQTNNAVQFGHVLCVNWDPRRVAAHIVKESKIKPVERLTKKEMAAKEMAAKEAAKEAVKETVDATRTDRDDTDKSVVDEPVDAVPDVSEVLMRDSISPTECCFCHLSAGIRIQCRRAKCAHFFHAMCAHEGNGHVELRTSHIPQFHAYCERHRDCTEDIGDLLAKLITRPIRLLVGRDDMRRFGTVAKHLPEYTTAAAILRDLAALMVGYCNKGLRACKTEPPDYNVKHLQVLQFFLNHVPQLEKVYGLPTIPVQDIVNDKKLFRRLERMFNPPRYLAKYPGPFSQQYTCDVCLDPFHERQHMFYCSGGDEAGVPHVQHWRCTKRRSNTREREKYLPVAGSVGAKKKRNAISIVQDGVRKDVTLPKGLQSMTDDIICGVCRAAVDARGLVASRKEAKGLDFEKKESKFVQNGCYINPSGSKGCSGFSYGTTSNATSRKPPRADGKPNSSLVGLHAAAQQALGPPKMDRINVQRTTRWLTCVAQIIRQVGTPAPKTTVSSSTTAASSDIAKVTSASNAPDTLAPVVGPSSTMPLVPMTNTVTAVPASTAVLTSRNPQIASTQAMPAINGSSKVELEAEKPPASAAAISSTRLANTSSSIKDASLVTPAIRALFDEAMLVVRPYDAYALSKLETAYDMLLHRSGPGVAVLRMLTHEYTRFVYIKHTRAVEKKRNQKRKRAEHEAQEHLEKERKRMTQEAERAHKKQMLAMRNKQRQHLKATSSK